MWEGWEGGGNRDQRNGGQRPKMGFVQKHHLGAVLGGGGGWALGSRGHLVWVPSDGVQRVAIAYGCPSGQTALPIFVGQEVSLSLPTGHTVAPLRLAGQLRRRGVVGGINRGF